MLTLVRCLSVTNSKLYCKVRNDGTNLIFSYSVTGVSYYAAYTVPLTTHFTTAPNNIGLGIADLWSECRIGFRLVQTNGLTSPGFPVFLFDFIPDFADDSGVVAGGFQRC